MAQASRARFTTISGISTCPQIEKVRNIYNSAPTGYLKNLHQFTANNRPSLEETLVQNQLTLDIEQALTGLVKLMKALRFYPKGHPSLQKAIDECMTGFMPMLSNQKQRAIQISQTGIYLEEVKVGEKNPALSDLALMLAERRVNQLIFLPGLPASDLLVLLEGLSTPAEEIYRIGGLPIFLKNHQVTTIWLNESSLDGALQKRKKLIKEIEESEKSGVTAEEETSSSQEKASDPTQQIDKIIEHLKQRQEDDTYRLEIDKLLSLAPTYFEQGGPAAILTILPLLLMHSQQLDRNHAQRNNAASGLERLLTDRVITQLVMQFKRTSLTPQQFQLLQKFIVTLGIRVAPQLLDLMSKEGDSTVRRRLSTLLSRMGEPLLDLLRDMVYSTKWYVVRNAVSLLGDLRLDAGISILEGLTNHPDQRVRRTLIRSLAMIGNKKAVAPLLKLAQDPVTTLRRPAVKALGATRCIEAVQPLLNIAQSFDPFGRQCEIRGDAISALGILGQPEAIPPLLQLAKRPNIFQLQRLEELRAEIILALGKLGDRDLEEPLNKWRKSSHGVVQRAAELSLATLLKRHDNSSTD